MRSLMEENGNILECGVHGRSQEWGSWENSGIKNPNQVLGLPKGQKGAIGGPKGSAGVGWGVAAPVWGGRIWGGTFSSASPHCQQEYSHG